MYPVPRLLWQLRRARALPPLPLRGTHESEHICWPWDLDVFGELNNGRTLTLYDLGRIPWFGRIGLDRVPRREGWQVAIVGASVRWRRRVHAMERLRMRTRALGWDERFLYSEQSLWKADGECASHILIRAAVSDRSGIVPSARVLAALGHGEPTPELPGWVRAWIKAEGASVATHRWELSPQPEGMRPGSSSRRSVRRPQQRIASSASSAVST